MIECDAKLDRVGTEEAEPRHRNQINFMMNQRRETRRHCCLVWSTDDAEDR